MATIVNYRDVLLQAAGTRLITIVIPGVSSADGAEALAAIADITSDSVLSANEKPQVVLDYDAIIAEQSGIDSQATTFGITTEKTAYDNAVTALTAYLTALSPAYNSYTTNTVIVGTTFRSKFSDVYVARQVLLNKIAALAASGALTDVGAITSPMISTINADTIVTGAIKGISVLSASHTTKGTYLTSSVTSGTQVMNVQNTDDFYTPKSGTYTRSGAVATVTLTAHGLVNPGAGKYIAYILNNGALVASAPAGGVDKVTILDANSFTIPCLTGAPSSGVFTICGGLFIADTVNDRQLIIYQSKTATTFTGCFTTAPPGSSIDAHFGLYTHNAGAVIAPFDKSISIDDSTNEMRIYSDKGDGKYIEAVTLGGLGQYDPLATFGYLGVSLDLSSIRPAIEAYCYNQRAIFGQSATSSGMQGQSSTSAGVYGVSNSGNGVVGNSTSGYDFYASGLGTNYGPFTGGHDGLALKTTALAAGDILTDSEIIFRKGLSNTIAINTLSNKAMQKGVIGVFGWRGPLVKDSLPTAMSDISGNDLKKCIKRFDRISFNAVGEGQINVCKEGGNLETGDLICSSSIAGKGMKQPDDIVRSYTVAKVRENVVWENGDESIKMVACIYLCG